jgi:hypothetical protein
MTPPHTGRVQGQHDRASRPPALWYGPSSRPQVATWELKGSANPTPSFPIYPFCRRETGVTHLGGESRVVGRRDGQDGEAGARHV